MRGSLCFARFRNPHSAFQFPSALAFPPLNESGVPSPHTHTVTDRLHSPQPAFTLIELLVVIGIIALMLVALIPAVNSLTKSSGRKAAIGSLLGVVEQARVHALKTGRASYIVFPAFTAGDQSTLDRYNYKAFAIYEEDPADSSTPKQITKWQTLPTGVALRASAGAPGSVTDLSDSSSLTPAATFAFAPDANATPVFHCIKFNANGEVESAASSYVEVAVFEGHVNGTTEKATGTLDTNGQPAARESLKIAHLTGRAERVE